MDLEDQRLYVKVSCGICRGTSRSCPYCDEQGKHFLEASSKRITEWLKNQDEENKMKFRKALEGI